MPSQTTKMQPEQQDTPDLCLSLKPPCYAKAHSEDDFLLVCPFPFGCGHMDGAYF